MKMHMSQRPVVLDFLILLALVLLVWIVVDAINDGRIEQLMKGILGGG